MLHLSGLESGLVLHSLYKYGPAILGALRGDFGASVAIEYVGLESVSATYTIKLAGIPGDREMNEEDIAYFIAMTESFLVASASGEFIDIYSVSVSGTKLIGTNTRRLQQGAEVEVSGEVFGAQAAFLDSGNFARRIRDHFKTQETQYIEKLARGGFRPGKGTTGDGYKFFTNVINVASDIGAEAVFTVDELPASSSEPNMLAIAIGCGVGGGILFLGSLYLVIRTFRHNKRFNSDVQDSRELRRSFERKKREKAERKLARAERRRERKLRREKKKKARELAEAASADFSTQESNEDGKSFLIPSLQFTKLTVVLIRSCCGAQAHSSSRSWENWRQR